MTIGFAAFRAIEETFPRYRGGSAKGSAIEVFPHAAAVVLAGCLPPEGSPRTRGGAGCCGAHGWTRPRCARRDQVDAALAALTGLFALERRFSAPGDPREGQIVLPAATLPAHPYRRGATPGAPGEQPSLPGSRACACGEPSCTSLTGREFAPATTRSASRPCGSSRATGQEAVDELTRRRWAIPPEMR